MKRKSYILLIVFLLSLTIVITFTFVVSGKTENPVPKYCTFSLSITNPVNERVFVTQNNSVTDEEDPISSFNLNSRNIEYKVSCIAGKIIRLSYKKESFEVYIQPGKVVSLSFDTKKLISSLSFTGAHSNINRYLISKQVYLKSIIPDFKALYSLNQMQFDSINDNSLKHCQIVSNQLLHAEPVLKRQVNLDLISAWLIRKLLFPGYHNYFSSEKVNVTPNYQEIIKLIPFNTDQGLLSNNYIELLSMYLDHKERTIYISQKPIVQQQLDLLILEEHIINTDFNNERLKKLFIGRLMWKYLELGFAKQYQSHFSDRSVSYASNNYSIFSKERYQALTIIDSGKTAPDFPFLVSDHVKSKLSGLKGKYIYINIWSLNCEASTNEILYLIAIKKQLRDTSKLVFLNINLDNDFEQINNFLEKNPLSGINASPIEREIFKKKYFIVTTPRYILIDRDGEIIEPFAARPSSPQLLGQLNRLLSTGKIL